MTRQKFINDYIILYYIILKTINDIVPREHLIRKLNKATNLNLLRMK